MQEWETCTGVTETKTAALQSVSHPESLQLHQPESKRSAGDRKTSISKSHFGVGWGGEGDKQDAFYHPKLSPLTALGGGGWRDPGPGEAEQ